MCQVKVSAISNWCWPDKPTILIGGISLFPHSWHEISELDERRFRSLVILRSRNQGGCKRSETTMDNYAAVLKMQSLLRYPGNYVCMSA